MFALSKLFVLYSTMASPPRQFDIIVYGASGYTGKYTAEYMARVAPTNLRWAMAGRSASKLEAVRDEIQPLNPDREPPAIETCSLEASELDRLAKKTRVLVNTVGPYLLHGEAVIQACIANRTHYLDASGETPWIRKMIRKHSDEAKAKGAIIIPQNAFESAFPDLLVLEIATFIRDKFAASTGDVMASLHELRAAPSGGTLDSLLTLFDTFPIFDLLAASDPFAYAPAARQPPPPRSWIQTLFGLSQMPGLGLLTTSLMGPTDTPLVNYSGALLDYGPHFRFEERARAKGPIRGAIAHWSLSLLPLVLFLPPIRWLLRRLIYQPGEGEDRAAALKGRAEFRMIGTTDEKQVPPRRAQGWATYEGGMYGLTGLLLATAAMTLVEDDECHAKKLGGGFLTPATLGHGYVERAKAAGIRMDVGEMTSTS